MGAVPFHTTRWSLVTRASDADPATAQRALGELCEAYWQPLYVFLRRSGRNDGDARDLVQSFCAQLLERGGLDGADRDTGRFRHYLLGAMRHFAANTARAERTDRRGGGALTWSLDDANARYTADPRLDASPEHAFHRRWALDLLARATARLHAEYASSSKQALLDALAPAVHGDGSIGHAAIAARLGTTEGALRVALHRLRSRMRELVRDEVAQTLANPSELDDELRALGGALAGDGKYPAAARNDLPASGSWPGEP